MDCNIEKCPLTARVISLEKTQSDHETRIRNQEETNISIAEMAKDIEYIAREVTDTKGEVTEIREEVRKILEEPKQRWDAVKLVIITAVIMTVIDILVAATM